MGQEIELKLEVSRQATKRLVTSPWLKKLTCGPTQTKRLVSVYYDTDGMTLRDKQSVLRVRRVDGRFIQTFKAPAAGAMNRLEWEVPIRGPKPDLHDARKKDTGGFNLRKLRKSLKPIFETNVSRRIVPIQYQGSRLELAVDHGQVETGHHRLPINEVELELKNGRPDSIVALGERLASQLDAAFGVASKAERGYALREAELDQPVRASPVILSPQMPAADAFEAVAMSCLHHFAANRQAVMAKRPEGIHQMRVGLRRLRAALSLFKEMLRGPQTEHIKAELKWLTEELGPARDMDVLIEEAIDPLASVEPRPARILKADIATKRDEGFARAGAAVQSDRYRLVVLRTAFWIMGGSWRKSRIDLAIARRTMPLRDFAARELARRTARVVKKLDKIEGLNPRRQHKLRIAIKKLRYGVEFFASLYDGKRMKRRRKKFAAVLKALQSSLGKLNDIRVHRALAGQYADQKRRRRFAAPKAFAMGLLSGRERSHVRALMKAARRDGRRLSRCRPFWK
jgi:triphosphatase